MKNNNYSAVAFVVVVWITLLLLLAKSAYDSVSSLSTGSFGFKVNNMGDLMNANP